jgi:hypothetical protein
MILDSCYVEEYLTSIGWSQFQVKPKVARLEDLPDLENGKYIGMVSTELESAKETPPSGSQLLPFPSLFSGEWGITRAFDAGGSNNSWVYKRYPDLNGGNEMFEIEKAGLEDGGWCHFACIGENAIADFPAGDYTFSFYITKGPFLKLQAMWSDGGVNNYKQRNSPEVDEYHKDFYLEDLGLFYRVHFFFTSEAAMRFIRFSVYYQSGSSSKSDFVGNVKLESGFSVTPFSRVQNSDNVYRSRNLLLDGLEVPLASRPAVFSSVTSGAGDFVGYECLRFS